MNYKGIKAYFERKEVQSVSNEINKQLGEYLGDMLQENFWLLGLGSSMFSYLQPAFANLPNYWKYIFAQKHVFDALRRIDAMLNERSSDQENIAIYPQPTENIFAALKKLQDPEKVKCVILCQDPYPNEHASGLCLSSEKNMFKRSLHQFFSAIYAYYGLDYSKSTAKPESGDLTYLAEQGILLLNCALTVEEDDPGSHMKEWKTVTDAILAAVNEASPYCVFFCWGEWATKACFMLPRYNPKHLYVCEPHPRVWSKKYVLTVAEKFKVVDEHIEKHTPDSEKENQLEKVRTYIKSENKNENNVRFRKWKSGYIIWMPPSYRNGKFTLLDEGQRD